MRLLLFFVFITSFISAQQSVRITYESKKIYPVSFLQNLSGSQKVAFEEAQKDLFMQPLQIMGTNRYTEALIEKKTKYSLEKIREMNMLKMKV